MKTLAMWLYGIGALGSVCLIGPAGLLYVFPFAAFIITVFLALVALFDVLFRGVKVVREQQKEQREHRSWIL